MIKGVNHSETTTNELKDSGNRTEYTTGAVRDLHEGKGRYDLIPWEAIHELALHCEQGALKYGERNCEKGIPIHSLIDSGIRHLSCYLRGMDDEPHLRAALWNVAFALWMEQNRPEMQDIPTRMKRKPKDDINCRLCLYQTMTKEQRDELGCDPCDTCDNESKWKPKGEM